MSKAASPAKKKSSSTTGGTKEKVTITAEVEEEVKALLKAGTWKEMKQESTGKTYFYNKATKATCWDLRKEIAKQKAASGGGTSSAAAASPVAASASETDGGSLEEKDSTASPAKKTGLKKATKSSKASTKSSDSNDEQKEEEEMARRAAQEARENEIRSAAARETASAVAAAVADVKAAADLERKHLENKEMQIREQETNLEHQRNVKLRDLLKYTDPLDRLVQENSMLQQLVVSGSSGHVALDFQAKYEAVVRTNNALTVQMGRMKQEYDAMQRALTDANFKIHQQQGLLQERQMPSGRSRDEELQLTMAHFREQNRELQQQVGELSLLLARGLNEVAFRGSAVSASGSGGNKEDGSEESLKEDFLSVSLSRVLDSSARQLLCTSCATALGKLRDQSIPINQSTIQLHSANSHRLGGSDATPRNHSGASYIGTGDFPSTSMSNQNHNAGGLLSTSNSNFGLSSTPRVGGATTNGATPNAASGAPRQNSFAGVGQHRAAQSSAPTTPPVAAGVPSSSGAAASPIMYGGFMVRNPKANF